MLPAILLGAVISCTKNTDNFEQPNDHGQNIDTLKLASPKDFLFNLPMNGDTLFTQTNYETQFRVAIANYNIEWLKIITNDTDSATYDSTILSSYKLRALPYRANSIYFLIRAVDQAKGDTIFFKSNHFYTREVENLSQRFVKTAVKDGRLNILWLALDKPFTDHYLVERYMGENERYLQTFETTDTVFTDQYYMGEKVDYKISVINKNGGRQNIWYFHKAKENGSCSVTPSANGGYDLHFSRCKYYNNFGEYDLTTGDNSIPEILFSSSAVADTICHLPDAKFAGEASFWLRSYPKEFPTGISAGNWKFYGDFLHMKYGEPSFTYEMISRLDNHRVAYLKNGNIYIRDMESNQIVDSVTDEQAHYGLLRTTPSGNYFYAVDENVYGSPVYFWSSNDVFNSPAYTFQAGFTVPSVSDNLMTIKPVPADITPSNLALYDVTNGSKIYTMKYTSGGFPPKISPNGDYFFLYDTGLLLCSYKNSSFKVIWKQTDQLKSYTYYAFNPLKNDTCYLWDSYNKKFYIKNAADFSTITSFDLDLETIISIDYYSGKILGASGDNLLVIDLNSGTLENKIPFSNNNFFTSGINTVIIGNTIYNNYGIKYQIPLK